MLFSKKLFLERYKDLHNRIFPELIERQEEQRLRYSSNGFNSPIWIYWHIVRTEDVGINRFIFDRHQVYKNWFNAIKAPPSLNGTGMGKEEMELLSQQMNWEALKRYRKAVNESTLSSLDDLDHEFLGQVPTIEQVKKIICTERTMPENMWGLLNLYYGKSKEWYLLHVCLTHPFYHLGQMNTLLKKG